MRRILRSVAILLFGTALFLGVPLLAWGIGDLPGFFSGPARTAYAVTVVVLQAFVAILLPEIGRAGDTGETPAGAHRASVLLLQILTLGVLFVAPYGASHGPGVWTASTGIQFSGLVLFAAGFTLMFRAEAALGRQFSIDVTIQKNHTLVTDGPYRNVRHPRYLGIVGCISGLSLVFGSWLGLLLTGGLVAVLVWRIRDEERLLSATFGREWDGYVARTSRLIPFIY